ncbi:MAG: 3-dehydroquinate synthase [Candidatus Methylomirabilales bacterium]
MTGTRRNIILSGFMATGKSTVGRRLAIALGYDFLDLDTLIAAEAGMPIAQLFTTQGEAAFRALEARMVERIAGRTGCVVATGGGTIVSPRNLETLKRSGVVVTLTADPDTILARLGSTEDRPMLWGGDRRERIRQLLDQRAEAYAGADLIVDASARSIDHVVNHILDFLALHHVTAGRPAVHLPSMAESLRVSLGRRSHDVIIGPALLGEAGRLVKDLGLARTGILITSPADRQAFGGRVLQSLEGAGFTASCLEFDDREEEKGLERLAWLYRQCAAARLERRSPVFALGGIVIGELSGFVAATYLRGVPLIHIPTSLIAQVDTSIGGKVGVNLPEGKNLVGAFYQPRLVITDVETLAALPAREFRAGLAEVVKIAAIRDRDFFEYLERNVEEVLSQDLRALVRLVRRACELKASIVEADEWETDVRSLLNFGHTVGHALEAATGYRGPNHGEAVAVGMVVAGTLAARRGICPPGDVERLKRVLQAFGLPITLRTDPAAVAPFVRYDKKIHDRALRFVLPTGIGDATVAVVENPDEVWAALQACA